MAPPGVRRARRLSPPQRREQLIHLVRHGLHLPLLGRIAHRQVQVALVRRVVRRVGDLTTDFPDDHG